MGIELPKWLIFKMVLFLEYWQFFGSSFYTKSSIVHLESFSACFWKKKVEIKLPILHGYRITKMVDFQNGLISRIFAVFWKRFFAQKSSIVQVESFSACFWKKKVEIKLPILHGL